MLSCVEAGRPSYAYRILEEGISDGLRFDDFSSSARSTFTGMIPPEAEEFRAEDMIDDDAAQAGGGSSTLYSDPLPQLWVRPPTCALEFDCECLDNGDANLAAAWAAVERQDSPVLFRGVGRHWPALHSWTLPALQESLHRGVVRVSPSPRVTFCRESHPDVQSGSLTPPSRSVIMDVTEFIERLHVGRGGRPPLLYGDDERCYLQALAPHALMRDVDFSFLSAAQQPPPLETDEFDYSFDTADDNGDGSASSVLGRLWVSAPGTVSPLHYDLTDSYLCQVRGTKRLVLWPPDTSMGALDPYPPSHALARRLRTDVTTPTAHAEDGGTLSPPSDLPGAARQEIEQMAVEAVLQPGDVLYFPADWAHHTEAVGGAEGGAAAEPSFSLGFRTDGQYLL